MITRRRWRVTAIVVAAVLAGTAAGYGAVERLTANDLELVAASRPVALADLPVAGDPVPAGVDPGPPPTLLPQPVDAPDPYSLEPVVEIGSVRIPKIGLDVKMFEGVTLGTLHFGPGHWPGTAMPGQLGNVVIAGHRVTNTRPFRNLDQLGPGDTAILTTADGSFTYEYVSTEIVDPSQTRIVIQTYEHTATFFACHPPGSARERIVIHWRLVQAPPADAAP